MDRLLYLGMTAAKHTEMAQTANANNLANASTAGFRADFHALMSQPIEGPGQATRVNAVLDAKLSDFSEGSIMSTGRSLDVAIQGEGWFVVQDAQGGEALSRRGDLHLTADGKLINGAGQPVMGDGGPLAVPEHDSLTIGSDGTVSVVPKGLGPESSIIVDRIRLVSADPAQLRKGEDGLIRTVDGATPPADADVRVRSGSLEGSNVNTVDAMVTMIELARRYEMQVKVMSTANTVSETGARLMRVE
ncbi:flagellar basal body rod protein FlgF [Spongiibacter tropicus]|uniref:flagellar basal body rod protein FlgF n=1 Tax=Spongiibacter tropicus TaxID=454602 RepID=UPI0035BE99DC